MEDFCLFLLATIGMSHIIVDGSIMEPFRNLVKYVSEKIKMPKIGEMVECYLCSGTWCGFLMGYIFIVNRREVLDLNCFMVVFACGCAGGFVSNLAAMVLNWIEAATIVNMPE